MGSGVVSGRNVICTVQFSTTIDDLELIPLIFSMKTKLRLFKGTTEYRVG